MGENQAPFFFKVLMWTAMKKIFTDKNNQEALFLDGPGKDLEFCIVRPGGLNVEPPTGVINVIEGEAGSIPRADVAAFASARCSTRTSLTSRARRASRPSVAPRGSKTGRLRRAAARRRWGLRNAAILRRLGTA